MTTARAAAPKHVAAPLWITAERHGENTTRNSGLKARVTSRTEADECATTSRQNLFVKKERHEHSWMRGT